MKEVEILVQVFDSKDAVVEKMKGFTSSGAKDSYDIYYYHPKNQNMQVTKDSYPREWLRLRQSDKNYLTFKKDHFVAEKWLYSDEHEVQIDNLETAKSMLSELGFKQLVELQIKKHTYSNENYNIIFEEVENLGFFMEVERKDVKDNEDVAEVKKQILEFIASLGLKVGSELNIGKPELMLKKSELFKPN